MSKVLDVQADSSSAMKEADEYTLDDFRKEQAEATKSGLSVQFEKTAEAAPASERVVGAETPKGETVKPKQVLTDQEKSDRKHANDGKRIPEFLRQLRDKDAEIARLRSENAATRTPAPATTKPDAKADGAPDPEDPKYKVENGYLLFMDDRADYRAELKLKAREEAQSKAKADSETQAGSDDFLGRMNAYQEANPEALEEFGKAFVIVRDALETEFPSISSAIAAHEKSPELIHYLGTNLDVFSRITSARGKPMAEAIFEGIVKDFEDSQSDTHAPVSEATTRKLLPKPPVNLNGRGRTPTGEEVQNKAAEDDDFTTWRQAEKAKPKTKSKWDR